MLDKLLKINNWIYYFALSSICLLFVFLINKYLYTDELFYSTLGEQFTSEQINNILTYKNAGWRQFIDYAVIPIIIIFRALCTSFCFFVGSLVQELRWKFKSLFNISLKADIVFSLNIACNFYYYIITENYNSIEGLGINGFSLLKWVGKENIPNWLIFAYNSINLFELLYLIVLVLLIKACFQLNYWKSTLFVLLTYGIGNYLFLTAMTFVYLSLI